MIKIGYQGLVGSNSEIAAKEFVKKYNFNVEGIELIPLISSENVSNNLTSKKIDFGVMAIKNNIGGIVKETDMALNKFNTIKGKDLCQVHIHHCLFLKDEESINNIKFIASHPQALLQTKHAVKSIFPTANNVEIEDTAIGAQYLSDGKLDCSYAVICSKQAGISNNLFLFKEDIEDATSITTFGLYQVEN